MKFWNTRVKRFCASAGGRRHGRLRANNQCDFRNEANHNLTIRSECGEQFLSPRGNLTRFLLIAAASETERPALTVHKEFLVELIEFACDKVPSLSCNWLIDFLHQGGFANASVSGNKHHFAGSLADARKSGQECLISRSRPYSFCGIRNWSARPARQAERDQSPSRLPLPMHSSRSAFRPYADW